MATSYSLRCDQPIRELDINTPSTVRQYTYHAHSHYQFFINNYWWFISLFSLLCQSCYLINYLKYFYCTKHVCVCVELYCYCMSSVHPSVYPSVMLVDCHHVRWCSCKVIALINRVIKNITHPSTVLFTCAVVQLILISFCLFDDKCLWQ